MMRYLSLFVALAAFISAGVGASAQSLATRVISAAPMTVADEPMGSIGSMDMTRSVKSGGNVGVLTSSLHGKPVVAQIHADWCPVCKAEHSTIDAVRAKYGDNISFVDLDVTNAKTAAAAAAKARQLGLGAFFDAHKSMTGTVAVINPNSGAVAAMLYNVTKTDAYTKAIDSVSQQLHS